MEDTNARRLTRFTLIATLIVSVIANVTHSVLADSIISLWLRVPGGVLWPVLTFLAIEIIVRTVWQRRASHYLARVLVLGPAIPALIISYNHQQSLLAMMGETQFVASIGPVAIDGLMIGCTLALLFTRSAPPPAPQPIDLSGVIDSLPTTEITVSGVYDDAVPRPAAASSFDKDSRLRRAVESLQAGMSVKEAADFSALSESYVRNYAAVVKTLLADPEAEIPPTSARRVKADVVSSIREWARSESVK